MQKKSSNEDISDTISFLSGMTLEQEMLFNGFSYYYKKKSIKNTITNLSTEKVKELNKETGFNTGKTLALKNNLAMEDDDVSNDTERTETIHYSFSFNIGNGNCNNEKEQCNPNSESDKDNEELLHKKPSNQSRKKERKSNTLQKLFHLIHKHWPKSKYPYSKELALKIIQMKNCKLPRIEYYLQSKRFKVFLKTHYNY